ncbi:unnamed protein product [Brassica rapa subsp. trilocularis]
METSHELNFINPLASKHEAEDSILRLSSSSSSSSSFSSCSSVEAEPRPDDQSPPTQIMERSTNNATSTPPYRIPPHVFEITSSTAPAEWSTLSNESLFSIHMGDNTFTEEIDYFKSGELTFPQPPSPRTPTLPSPPQSKNQGGASGVVEEVKTPVHIDKKAAETDKAYHASKDQEQKAAASIRDVIMANKDKTNKLDHSVSRRSEDFSVKSFAFPVPTKEKVFMGQNLIWVMILLGQIHGYKSCIQKERMALLKKENPTLFSLLGPMTQRAIAAGNKSLRRLRKLEILFLDLNEFNSSIFPFLNAATSLTKLSLKANNMDGPVPVKGICKLKNLQELDLTGNKLVGHFPLCLTNLTRLRVLDLSSNQLTGSIPSSLSNLESLEYLSLLDNNFEGFFSFGSLTKLSMLRVFKIQLVPSSIRKFLETKISVECY